MGHIVNGWLQPLLLPKQKSHGTDEAAPWLT